MPRIVEIRIKELKIDGALSSRVGHNLCTNAALTKVLGFGCGMQEP